MKEKQKNKFLILIAAAIFCFAGCSTAKNWQGNLDCNMPAKEIIDNAIRILIEEGYSINSYSNDFVTASVGSYGRRSYLWNISVFNNRIIANATLTDYSKYGQNFTSLGDNTGSGHTKYWRVRRKLEKLCGNQMIIINTLEKSNTKEDEFKK